MNLSFRLKGKDWFGLYLAALVFYFVPLIGAQVLIRPIPTNSINTGYIHKLGYTYGLLLLGTLSGLILITPIIKRFIGSICIDERPFTYGGQIGRFFWLNIGNGLLSLITLFIYLPWYLTKAIRYVVNNTSNNNSTLSFNGKGGRLFVLLLLTLLLPMIVLTIITIPIGMKYAGRFWYPFITQIITFFIMIPYIYYVYKWMVNISYKDYLISWDTKALESMGVILREIVLSVITIGIYSPVACAKLYAYFMNRTVITQQDKQIYAFRVTFNYFGVWKTLWAQLLLTIVTVGIYGAWAYCKATAIFINNTSIVEAGSV